jgi:hypothetical protein
MMAEAMLAESKAPAPKNCGEPTFIPDAEAPEFDAGGWPARCARRRKAREVRVRPL